MAITTREFYLTRADECAREAAAASLENVRERSLRSEAVWRDMADRVERTSQSRAVSEAAKLAAATHE
jgi:hypothetical protein